MKVLLVGPYPPPHGGVSVHLRSLRTQLEESGVQCAVLNVEPRAPKSDRYIKVNGAFDFLAQLVRHAWKGWTFHVHTNGHNRKSWLIALACGATAQIGPGCWLTLHSGLMPEYMRSGSMFRRALAGLTCALYNRIICVNEEIRSALLSLRVSERKLKVKEAYIGAPASHAEVPADLAAWMKTRSPLLSTTMVMRPEYGYEVLTAALTKLRKNYPNIGCVVMGVDGTPNSDSIWHAGDVDHSLCFALMSHSDIFVRPTFKDGDSISVREAHAAGIPVVASRVGNRPAGTLLFEPGDVDGLIHQVERFLLPTLSGWDGIAEPNPGAEPPANFSARLRRAQPEGLLRN